MTFKPMLAPSESLRPKDLLNLRGLPTLASPKLDGIRCCIIGGKAMSRNLKPIPNKFIRDCLMNFPQLDGELMLRDPDSTFQDVTSAVMSRDGRPDFCFWVFDCFENPDKTFGSRFQQARDHVKREAAGDNKNRVAILEHSFFAHGELLQAYEQKCVDDGFEGIMLRSPSGLYKYGRATLREGTLIKVKRFTDSEAEVIGFEEEMHNANKPKVNALGLTERSTHKANKVGKDTLGKLVCIWQGMEIRVAGFSDAEADKIWSNRAKFVGKMAKFAYQELTTDGLPRFPTFKGWRDDRDK
jgi:DNA ligase-1